MTTITRFQFRSQSPPLGPPIDTVGVTAYAGYSLRKLRAAYNGNCIKVLRSSDSTQMDIGFDAVGNLDVATLLSFVGSGDGLVTTWYDQVGAHNLTNTVGAGNNPYPRIVHAGVLETTGSGTIGVNLCPGGLSGLLSTGVNYCYVNNTAASYVGMDTFVIHAQNFSGPGIYYDVAGEIIWQPISSSPGSIQNLGCDHQNGTKIPTLNPGYMGNQQYSTDSNDLQGENNLAAMRGAPNVIPSTFQDKFTYGGLNVQYAWQHLTDTLSGITIGEDHNLSGFTSQAYNGWVMELIIYDGSHLLTAEQRSILFFNQQAYWRINISLLLDSVNYPCGYAFSTRKLRAGYNGPCMNVRRASDNTTMDIGFDGSGNLDTATLLSFCGVGDGFVTKWYDQGYYTLNVTQATNANQPQIVSAGSVITQNGRPILFFNNTTVAGTIGLSAVASNGVGGATNFTTMVVKNAYSAPIRGDQNPSPLTTNGAAAIYLAAGYYSLNVGSFFYPVINNVNPSPFSGTNRVPACTFNLEHIAIWGGTSLSTATAWAIGNIPGGASNYGWNGYIGEVIGWGLIATPNDDPVAGDRQLIYNNQKTYWGTP
jgi:hypothetical protein